MCIHIHKHAIHLPAQSLLHPAWEPLRFPELQLLPLQRLGPSTPQLQLGHYLIHENDLGREIGVLGGIRPIRACELAGFCKDLLPIPPEGSLKIEVRRKTLRDLIGGSKVTIFEGRPRLQVSYGTPQEPVLFPE